MTLDRINRKILSVLQKNARMTNQKLADKVGLSPSSCLNRVRKLEEEGFSDLPHRCVTSNAKLVSFQR